MFRGSAGEPFVCEINFVIVQIGIFSQEGPNESNDIHINIYERVDLITRFILKYIPHIEFYRESLRRALYDDDSATVLECKRIFYLVYVLLIYLLSYS